MNKKQCLPCRKKREFEKTNVNTCGNFIENTQNIKPIMTYPTKTICEQEVCKILYPLDDPKYGIHSEYSIPIKDDEESGFLLDRSIPFSLIDFRDSGRSGSCSKDCTKRGKILNYYREDGKTLAYQLESKNWHSYLWYIDPDDGTCKLICKQDRRIPVEALSPYSYCEYNPYDCQTDDCENKPPVSNCDSDNPCPFKVVSLVCDNGKCNVGWLNNPISTKNTDSVNMVLEPKKTGGIELSANLKICPESSKVFNVENCGLNLNLCLDGGLEKKDCGLSLKICRKDENGNINQNDRVLTLNECGLYFNVKNTDSINLNKTINGLTADLKYSDTNTVDHNITNYGLVSNIRYQDRPSTKISEDVNGFFVDVKLLTSGGLRILEDGLGIKLSNCGGNLTNLQEDGLCTKFYKDDRFFRGDGTISNPLILLAPSITVGATAADTTINTASGSTTKTIVLDNIEPPFPAPEGYKWVATLSSTLTIEANAQPTQIDQVILAGHNILVNGIETHSGGGYHAVGNILTIPNHSIRITNTTGGTYNIKQNGITEISMRIFTYTDENSTGSFFPSLRCINPSYSGFLHIVRA